MRRTKLKQISLTLKCACGHDRGSHKHFRERCLGMHGDSGCTCGGFHAVARQRGLTHARRFLSPDLTLCGREGIHPGYFRDYFPDILCPECKQEALKQRPIGIEFPREVLTAPHMVDVSKPYVAKRHSGNKRCKPSIGHTKYC